MKFFCHLSNQGFIFLRITIGKNMKDKIHIRIIFYNRNQGGPHNRNKRIIHIITYVTNWLPITTFYIRESLC